MAVALMMAGIGTTLRAQTPLDAQLVLRPLTPGDVSVYSLPADIEVSGGLSSVGVGQPVYLEADVNLDIPASDITNVTWALSAKPTTSTVTLQPSPLGTNVPVYEPADRLVSQVASRKLLRPDADGSYTVTATIETSSNGATNITATTANAPSALL